MEWFLAVATAGLTTFFVLRHRSEKTAEKLSAIDEALAELKMCWAKSKPTLTSGNVRAAVDSGVKSLSSALEEGNSYAVKLHERMDELQTFLSPIKELGELREKVEQAREDKATAEEARNDAQEELAEARESLKQFRDAEHVKRAEAQAETEQRIAAYGQSLEEKKSELREALDTNLASFREEVDQARQELETRLGEREARLREFAAVPEHRFKDLAPALLRAAVENGVASPMLTELAWHVANFGENPEHRDLAQTYAAQCPLEMLPEADRERIVSGARVGDGPASRYLLARRYLDAGKILNAARALCTTGEVA